MKLSVKLTILLSIYSLLSYGITRHVPGTYPTIQAGLNACISGDTVLVQPGTYVENIIWPLIVNDIKLIGVSGSLSTTISAGASGRVLYINNPGLDTNTVISGFTLTNGIITSGSGYGAGAYLLNSTVLLEDVTITGNRVIMPGGHGYGAGLHMSNSSSVIRNCTISNNAIDTATWCYGGGVYISGGAPTFTNVTIANNSARAENWCYGVGLYARDGADLTLNEVRVTGNTSGDNAIWYYGYGIYMDDVTADLFNVLVASNKAGSGGSFNYGGGVYCDGTLGVVNMMNCTITDNTKTGNGTITGSGVYARDAAVLLTNSILYNSNSGQELSSNTVALVSAWYSNIRGGYTGLGNLNAIPGFISTSDFHLALTSPCAGTGTLTGAPFIDLDGNSRPLPLLTMPDMGCYEVDQSATGIAVITVPDKSINIYPNPVISGQLLTIENGVETFTITDVSGRTVFRQTHTGGSLEIPTTGWDAGWYFVYSPERKVEKLSVIR